MLPRVDDSSWPIVAIDYGETITFDEITELGAALLRIFQKRGAMVTLINIGALRATTITAMHRKKLADEADKLAARGAFLAEAVIVPNAIVRALYAGYTWASQRRTFPSRAFPDPTSATVWARQQAHRSPTTEPR
jgi:hypothetical protein